MSGTTAHSSCLSLKMFAGVRLQYVVLYKHAQHTVPASDDHPQGYSWMKTTPVSSIMTIWGCYVDGDIAMAKLPDVLQPTYQNTTHSSKQCIT